MNAHERVLRLATQLAHNPDGDALFAWKLAATRAHARGELVRVERGADGWYAAAVDVPGQRVCPGGVATVRCAATLPFWAGGSGVADGENSYPAAVKLLAAHLRRLLLDRAQSDTALLRQLAVEDSGSLS